MKALFSGIGLAAMAGLLMGAAMKPQLDAGDRPAGPQMFAGWSGARSTGPFDDGMAFVGYNGQVPDYVLGTDWQKTAAWPDAHQEAYEPPMEVASLDPAAQPEPQPVAHTAPTFEPPAAEPVTYPSMSGGAAYGAASEATSGPAAEAPAPPSAEAVLG